MQKTPASSSRTASLKVLLALTAAVLLAHLAVLEGAPMSLRVGVEPGPPEPVRSFSTRTIEPVATALPAPARPARAAPAPRRRSATIARANTATAQAADSAMPSPSPSPSPEPGSAEVAPQPPAVIAAAEDPSQAASSPHPQPAESAQPSAAPRLPRDHALVAGAYTVPDSVRLKFQVQANKFPFGANAELLWQRNGASYEARLELSAFGQARIQSSRGQVTGDGLAPTRFSDKFRSEVAAHFEREKGKVTFSANTPDVPLLAGAQDRLSVLVQLAAMMAGDPGRYPAATTIAIQTIGPRDADTWLFTVGSAETLTLPGGELATLKLVRNPRQEFDQKVELWLAPALGYLPARIRITEPSGDFVDQKWLATQALTGSPN